jgi:hypothetical protein
MAFVVLPTGVPLVPGMPFFTRFQPHILWRERVFLIHSGTTTHVLRADALPRMFAQLPVNNVCVQSIANTSITNTPALSFSIAHVNVND